MVLVGLGVRGAVGPGALPPLPDVAARMAERLALTPLPLPEELSPDAALGALQREGATAAGQWLAPLPVDPGLPLGDGSCWAQVLGAWRQPVLLVITAEQLQSGLPAAGTALLRQWRCPLLGVVQWGGGWEAALRRGDGLPWLGMLAEAGGDVERRGQGPELEAELALPPALALRREQLRRS